MNHSIFVYGTLKSGHSRNSFLHNQRYLGTATTLPQYKMYRYGSFPAMIETDPEQGDGIMGELYEVDDSCLMELDEVEGVKHGLFHRRNVKLQSINFVALPLFRHTLLISDRVAIAYFFCDKNKLLSLKDCGVNWTFN